MWYFVVGANYSKNNIVRVIISLGELLVARVLLERIVNVNLWVKKKEPNIRFILKIKKDNFLDYESYYVMCNLEEVRGEITLHTRIRSYDIKHLLSGHNHRY